jgi:8-oxo-dGTP pyrophosphatase MutT (NUDIX family)
VVELDRYRQRVARPEGARRAPLPPWAGAPKLPNPSIDEIAAVLDSTDDLSAHDASTSAVLVPLVARPEGLAVIFTRRASTLTRDAGNLAFPGGHRERDESLVDTALRETEEEIGLDRSEITVIGALDPAYRLRDEVQVSPLVGAVAGAPVLVAHPAEVEEIFEVPLASLFADGVGWEEHWTRSGLEVQVAFFADEVHFGDDLLWGLSARITWQLLMRIWVGATGDAGS